MGRQDIFFSLAFQVVMTTCFALFGSSLGQSISANFVFGDSLVDAGNNNYIASLSKANYAPNGIDFGAPTGRYTNGRTIIDIVGKLILLLYILYNFLQIFLAYIYLAFLNRSRVGF